MSAHGRATHACPGCGCEVDNRLFACRGCWYELPAELRTSIERTKRKSLIDPDRMAAVVAAISWYNATDPLAAEVAP